MLCLIQCARVRHTGTWGLETGRVQSLKVTCSPSLLRKGPFSSRFNNYWRRKSMRTDTQFHSIKAVQLNAPLTWDSSNCGFPAKHPTHKVLLTGVYVPGAALYNHRTGWRVFVQARLPVITSHIPRSRLRNAPHFIPVRFISKVTETVVKRNTFIVKTHSYMFRLT